MKTADEIKKGLECCLKGNCKDCPYRELYRVFRCKTERTRDAIGYIRKLESRAPRWISVEERRPEVNDDVIVFVQHPISGHCWTQIAHRLSAMAMDECDEHDEWWLDGSGETVRYITHWMPLPEPPEVTKP